MEPVPPARQWHDEEFQGPQRQADQAVRPQLHVINEEVEEAEQEAERQEMDEALDAAYDDEIEGAPAKKRRKNLVGNARSPQSGDTNGSFD